MSLAGLRVDGLDESVAAARAVLDGQPGPARDFVLANAAAGLRVADRVETLEEGVALAAEAIDEGKARHALETMARVSQEGRA